MKVLEEGYVYKQRCNECNALLLIEYDDIETISYRDYDGCTESYDGFYCPVCHKFNRVNKTKKIVYHDDGNDISYQKKLGGRFANG